MSLPDRSSAIARTPIEPPELHPMHLRDAAAIILTYEGEYVYPKSLAEHLKLMADKIERARDAS